MLDQIKHIGVIGAGTMGIGIAEVAAGKGQKVYLFDVNTEFAQKITDQAIYIYNNLRTHFSLDLRKPFEVHNNPNIKYKSYRKNRVNLLKLKI